MADFTNNLALVNGIAERSSGFISRYIDESGNAISTRPYADPRIIVNFSVWESVDALERFVATASSMLGRWPAGAHHNTLPVGNGEPRLRPYACGLMEGIGEPAFGSTHDCLQQMKPNDRIG